MGLTIDFMSISLPIEGVLAIGVILIIAISIKFQLGITRYLSVWKIILGVVVILI
jgi:hypothetical protein